MSDDITRQQSATEEKINEMVQQSRILEAYMNDIINREATITRLMEEAHLASNAVQNIADESDIESLASVGIGVYMKALIPPVKKLLINLGAGVAIEKSREDTLNYIESKIREFEIALRQLVNQKQQIETRMEQIQNQINQMLKQAPAQSGSFRNHTSGQPQSH
jgi:prefoldin alpha subunit